jgi:hypothetical protein
LAEGMSAPATVQMDEPRSAEKHKNNNCPKTIHKATLSADSEAPYQRHEHAVRNKAGIRATLQICSTALAAERQGGRRKDNASLCRSEQQDQDDTHLWHSRLTENSGAA